jgi:hypothetical protein
VRQHGLRDGGGGHHVGLGTHNRVFAPGGGYLKVLAVIDPQEAAGSVVAARWRPRPRAHAAGDAPGVRAVGLGSEAVIR